MTVCRLGALAAGPFFVFADVPAKPLFLATVFTFILLSALFVRTSNRFSS